MDEPKRTLSYRQSRAAAHKLTELTKLGLGKAWQNPGCGQDTHAHKTKIKLKKNLQI